MKSLLLVTDSLIKEHEMSSENSLNEISAYFTEHRKAVSSGKGSVKVFNGSEIHSS